MYDIFASLDFIMDQLTLGVGTRLQRTRFGPGIIVDINYATYIISFIDSGIKEIDEGGR